MVPVRGVGRTHAAGDMPNFGRKTHVSMRPFWISLVIIISFHTHLVARQKHHFNVALGDY